MARLKNPDRAVLRIIFAASLASLSYEITLLRIFSISLWHHFAFMVMSIAMLGIAAGGSALVLAPKLRNPALIPAYGLLLAALLPLSYILADHVPFDPARLSWDRLQLVYIMLRYLVLSLPFLFFGMIMASAYNAAKLPPGMIYASDLIGAGAGSLVVLALFYTGGPENIPFLLSMVIASMVMISGGGRRAAAVILFLNILILVLRPQIMGPHLSPYKPLERALQFPGAESIATSYSPHGRIDLFRSPAIRFAPGLSLRYLDALPDQVGLSIDAGEIHAMTDEHSRSALKFLRHLPMGLPYLLADKGDVLVLDPKSGMPVLVAQAYGAASIQRVESNPAVVKTVKEFGSRLSSSVYSENTYAGMGRSWLASAYKLFDVIECSSLGAMPGGIFGFAEDYRFTVEAFQAYLEHLKPAGFLSITAYLLPPPRMEYRLLATLIEAAQQSGIERAENHLAAIRSWDTLTIIMKKSPLSSRDLTRIREFSRIHRFDLVYYPGITAAESNRYVRSVQNEQYHAFRQLLDPASRQSFLDNYLFDVRPSRDDMPFFHYYLKMEHIGALYRLMGEKWQYFVEEGYLLPVLFGQALLLSVAMILLPMVRLRHSPTSAMQPRRIVVLFYFGCLGLAYLFIEMSLIQKMILPLGNPVYAAALVIASVLISSGLGSLAGNRITALKSGKVLLVLAGVIICYALLFPKLLHAVTPWPFPAIVLVMFLLMLPLGFLMGIPFPLGMARIGKDHSGLIPWAWAVNGCCSVIAPILAVMMALTTGFTVVLISGAALYVLGFAVLSTFTSPSASRPP